LAPDAEDAQSWSLGGATSDDTPCLADQQLLDQIQFGVFAIDLKGAKLRERFGWGAQIALRPRPGVKD